MRTLFSFVGGTGHFNPLVGIARTAVAAGHAVAFACRGLMVDTVTGAGFTALATSPASAARAPRAPGAPRRP